MNIIMITKVKNESDIIESFLRYHSYIYDNILVIDNGSIDGTYEIVNALIKEGLPIELVSEAHSDFEEFRFANLYTRKYIKKWNADLVVFMDADEFLCSNTDMKERKILENMSYNKVHLCHWKTYLYDNKTESSIFDIMAFPYHRDENKEIYTKVFVPAELLLNNNIIITEGNHGFQCSEHIETQMHSEISFCHFPLRNHQQYKKQIIINSIGMMANPLGTNYSGSHWKQMLMSSGKDVDLESLSQHYAFYEDDDKINEYFENKYFIKLKYKHLIMDDIETVMFRYMEIQALKLKEARINDYKCGQKLLVFGTGAYCRRMMRYIPSNCYIVAFVDSNKEREFQIFNNKVVISPEKMRFFEFSKIIIASEKYLDEMRGIVLQEMPSLNPNDIMDFNQFIIESY